MAIAFSEAWRHRKFSIVPVMLFLCDQRIGAYTRPYTDIALECNQTISFRCAALSSGIVYKSDVRRPRQKTYETVWTDFYQIKRLASVAAGAGMSASFAKRLKSCHDKRY